MANDPVGKRTTGVGFFGADFFSGSLATRDEMDYKHNERDEKQNVNGEAGYVIHHEGADPDEEKD